jgi:hypothetical protein
MPRRLRFSVAGLDADLEIIYVRGRGQRGSIGRWNGQALDV